MTTKADTKNATTTDSTAVERVVSKAQLTEIKSWEDALAVAEEAYGKLATSDELGDGFMLLKGDDQKATLVGVPFLFMTMTISESDEITRDGKPTEYVTARVVTKDSKKYILVDGGTGVFQQCKDWMDKNPGKRGGLVALYGLTRSDYKYTNEKGDQTPATTFYIDEAGQG